MIERDEAEHPHPGDRVASDQELAEAGVPPLRADEDERQAFRFRLVLDELERLDETAKILARLDRRHRQYVRRSDAMRRDEAGAEARLTVLRMERHRQDADTLRTDRDSIDDVLPAVVRHGG